MPLTRTELDEMVADLSDTAATFTRRVCHTEPRPQMLALVGGAAAMPALADAVTSAFAGPVAVVPEPATAAAHGAALLAASSRLSSYPSVGASTPTAGTPGGKVSGALAGALVIGALVAGYATDQIASDDTAVSPAGTSGQATTQPAAAVPDTGHTQIPSEDPHAAVTTTAADNGYARTDTPVPYPTPTVPESSTTTPATTTPPSTPESTTSERPESPADVPGTDRPWQLPGTLPSVPLPTVPLPTLPGTTPSESTTPSSTTSAPPSEFAPPETTTETSSTAAPAEEATSTSPPLIEPSPAA